MMIGVVFKKQMFSVSLISEKEAFGSSIIIIISNTKKMLQSTSKMMADTQTSINGRQCIKPCLRQQVISENSSFVQENSLKLLKTGFQSVFDRRLDEKDEDNQSEVSLEEDILEEHKQAIQQLFSKSSLFLNHQQGIKSFKQNKKQEGGAIFKEITLEHYLHLLFAKLRAVKPSLINLFNSYLREEKIFYRFLQHLYYSYPTPTVHQVFKYLFYIWELYYQCLHLKLSINQAISISIRIYEKIIRHEQESKLNSAHLSIEAKAQRRRLIKGLSFTVILVMEKCFTNPYLHSQNKNQKQQEEQTAQNYRQHQFSHKKIKRDEKKENQ